MLMKVLMEIEKGQHFSNTDLARRLGISVEVLNGVVEQLFRMAYLEKVEAMGCGSEKCNCGCGKDCSASVSDLKMMKVTKKGIKALERIA